jgi:hypothetical protein
LEKFSSTTIAFIYSLFHNAKELKYDEKKTLIRHAMSIEHRITSGKAKQNGKNQHLQRKNEAYAFPRVQK